MKELTRAEYAMLHDIFYDLVEPRDKPDYAVINSLENKGLIMKVYEKGDVIGFEITVFGSEIMRGFDYDDWFAELRYNRRVNGHEHN